MRGLCIRSLIYLGLVLGLVPMALPFVWMALTSLKPLPEITTIPPGFLPARPTFQAYVEIFTHFAFARYLLNSLLVAAIVVIGVLIVSTLAGYAFAKFRFPGREVVFVAMLASLMVPLQVRMIPLYLITVRLGLTDTLFGIALPWLFDPFGIFLMRQFFVTIPTELIEAARIDGASEFRILWKVVAPLLRPAFSALGIFTLVVNWEEFLWPLIVTSRDDVRTLPVGLQVFSNQYMSNVHWQMAGAVVAAAPLLLTFLMFQREFIRGIALTGLKG
jgi:multiple sugar transport system permease protein